jgi:DNA-binding GntR family transcriptional regulator
MTVPSSSPLADSQNDGEYGRKGARATAAVRSLIADGILKPGEHLRQDDLATRIGSTRVPVREAFKTLLAEGVLEHRPNYGHYVARLTSDELTQICWLRDVTEDQLAMTVRWPDRASIDHLHSLNDTMLALLGCKIQQVVEADRTFHQCFCDFSPQRIVARESQRMWELMQPYRMFMDYGHTVVTRMHTEHNEIITALQANNLESYTSAVSAHQRHIYKIVDHLAAQEEH